MRFPCSLWRTPYLTRRTFPAGTAVCGEEPCEKKGAAERKCYILTITSHNNYCRLTRCNGFKLKEDRFILVVRKKFSTVPVVRHCASGEALEQVAQ